MIKCDKVHVNKITTLDMRIQYLGRTIDFKVPAGNVVGNKFYVAMDNSRAVYMYSLPPSVDVDSSCFDTSATHQHIDTFSDPDFYWEHSLVEYNIC
jgi:hypothetical protein